MKFEKSSNIRSVNCILKQQDHSVWHLCIKISKKKSIQDLKCQFHRVKTLNTQAARDSIECTLILKIQH